MFDGSKLGGTLMQFDFPSIDTIGPLQPEFLIGLALSIWLAFVAARVAHSFFARVQNRVRRFTYGGIVAMILGVPVLLLPSPLVQWLYSLQHPKAYVCPFVVGWGYFVPVVVYAYRVWALSRTARKHPQHGLDLAPRGAAQ